MHRFSQRYGLAVVKSLDGMPKGSSSLWAARAHKGYGFLPTPDRDIEGTHPPFDYSPKEVALARRWRINYYERILSPLEIPTALRYSPVTMDIEVYSSVWSDMSGIFTIPDEEDLREELDHTVLVIGHDEDGLRVDTG